MAIRDDWAPGEILTAGDLNDTFSAKLDTATPTFTGQALAPDFDTTDYNPQYAFASDIDSGITYDDADVTLSLTLGYADRFKVHNDGLITGSGRAMGVWQTWTPTFVNWSRGNGAAYCAKMEMGRLVAIRFRFDMGSTTTYSGNLQVTGAPTAKSSGYYMTGACAYLDSSLGNSYNGNVVVNGSTLEFYNNASTARGAVASTTPFSWASGDLIYGVLVYEANADPS